MADVKPTLSKPVSDLSKNYQKTFNDTMSRKHVKLSENTDMLYEVDNELNEVEQSLKKKIFSLAKMEALTFSDPKLASVYEEMSENGEEKYGYHYNETIMNMLFNDYVLNSPKYLQKYKQAVPKEKKRRDKSGINQLKKHGEKMQTRNLVTKPEPKPVTENDEQSTPVIFLVNERDPKDPDLFAYFPEENYDKMGNTQMGYSHIGQHSAVHLEYAEESREATPEEYQPLKVELESLGYNLDVLNGQNNTIGESGEMLAQYVQNAFTNRQGSTPINFIINYLKSKYDISREKIKTIVDNMDDINTFYNMNPNPDKLKNYADEIYQEISNPTNETSGSGGAGGGGAFSGSGQYSAPLGYEKKNLVENSEEEFEEPGEPTEPDEEDCVISSNGNKYSVSCSGKFLGDFVEWDDAMNKVITWQEANKWYPNIWFISDHGNASIIDREGNILKEGTTSGSVGGPAGGSGAYYGPAMWGKGDLLPAKGEAPVKKKPAWKGGTIIQENYLVETDGFEKFFNALNEEDLSYQNKLGKDYEQSHTKSNKGLGVSEVPQSPERTAKKKGIDDNTALFIGQDVDKMRNDDVKILHNDMTKKNSFFPHKDNPNLKDDGIAGTLKEVNKNKEDSVIIDKTSAFTSDTVKDWDKSDTGTEMNTLKTGDPDKPNLKPMEEAKKINEKAKSKEQQRLFGMAHAVQKGELSPSKVGGAVKNIAKDVSPEDVKDFAKTKHKGLPEKVKKVDEETQTIIGDNPESMSNKALPVGQQSGNIDMGVRSTGGGSMSESLELLEQINNELKAFSIHQEKLKKMTEDRKPSALVLRDRVGSENEKNFKKDLKDSSVSKIVDIENSLEYADQQTEVKDPHELAEKLEKGEKKSADMESGEALKDVGDSANDKGDEIPKRNMTEEEAEEVKKYKLNLKDYVFDNEPGKRFEDRMKKDMGEENYKQRQTNLKFRGKAPMYNKDPQPTAPTTADKVQFDKEQTGWNERVGLKEAIVTGRFVDALGKSHILDFRLNESKLVSGDAKFIEPLFQLDFTGFGNKYENKPQGKKVVVNESVEALLSECKYYTNGKDVFAVKNPVQKLNENEQKVEKPVVNEQMNKMKHLLNYNTKDFLKQNKIL